MTGGAKVLTTLFYGADAVVEDSITGTAATVLTTWSLRSYFYRGDCTATTIDSLPTNTREIDNRGGLAMVVSQATILPRTPSRAGRWRAGCSNDAFCCGGSNSDGRRGRTIPLTSGRSGSRWGEFDS